ncbi:MAG: trypsin-like peptidase domain-containing protein [Acetobacteraceae bacterium]|nr:trypsin-like peptidase domain-containing protein [Acetobacteraceae bacterium]
MSVLANKRRALLAGAAVLGLGAVVLAGPGSAVFAQTAAAPAPAQTHAVAMVFNYADMAEKVGPAVVSVAVSQAVREQAFDPDQLPPFMRRFFENMPEMRGQQEGPRAGQRVVGQGSGFIIDPDGIIVTNFHVVGRADQVKVKLSDGRVFDARVLGGDPRTDLAVLKIDAPGRLPFVRFAENPDIRPGEPVMAMGNPFGLGGTVTSGIISARGRDIGAGPADDFIQHDAPINPGNSGGPLFNINGEVIGVNTAILSPSGGSIGIGFAIPSPVAQKIVAELREHGKVSRGFIGVSLAPVDPVLAGVLGRDNSNGAVVQQVVPDSPAAKAGLRVGDLITAVDGHAVDAPRDLVRAASIASQGSRMTLTVLRRDGSKEIAVTLAAAPDQPRQEAPKAQPRRG